MKNSKMILSAVVAVGAMLSMGAASAADLAVKALPYTAPPPPFSWSGFYIGGNAGAGVLLDQGFQSNNFLSDRHGIGGLAGGQIGYNWQMGIFVLGIEGEGFWSGMRVTQDQFSGINPGTLNSTATIKNKWDYDIAGRFGIAIDHALIYGKAGWVAGNFGWNLATPLDPSLSVNGSATLNGLLIGLGLEYAFTNSWTAKFEYDYFGFGAKDVVFTTVPCSVCTPFTTTQNVSADKHIFKLGVNYLFNAAAPLVARY